MLTTIEALEMARFYIQHSRGKVADTRRKEDLARVEQTLELEKASLPGAAGQ